MSTSKMQGAEKNSEPYHHGDLKRALLRAATKIVVREGAGALTMREAARVAGVSHNAPYRHFDSLEALLAAVATEGFLKFHAVLDKARKGLPTPGRRKAAMGRAYLDFALANPRLYRLMFGGDLDRRKHPDLEHAAGLAFDLLASAVAPKNETAFAEAIAAWAFVHGLANLILDRQLDPDDPVVAGYFASGG